MKKHLLLLTVVTILSLASQSQVVSKGDKLFGGSVSFSFYHNSGANPPSAYPSSSNVALIPSFAWVIKNDVAIGIKGNFTYARSGFRSSGQKYSTTTWNLGPEFFYKKYKTLNDQFGIYFNHGINGYYAFGKQKNTWTPDYYKTIIWGGGYNFTPGVFYKFSSRFLGEANIGGVFGDYNVNSNVKTFSTGVSFFKYFNFGINYVIGKKA